jgi:LPXTG-motif cell wall-anchored protein
VGPHTGPPRLASRETGNEKGSSMFIGIGTIVLIIIIVLIVLALRR